MRPGSARRARSSTVTRTSPTGCAPRRAAGTRGGRGQPELEAALGAGLERRLDLQLELDRSERELDLLAATRPNRGDDLRAQAPDGAGERELDVVRHRCAP